MIGFGFIRDWITQVFKAIRVALEVENKLFDTQMKTAL